MEQFDPKTYITRKEKYLANMAGSGEPYPEPITRHEKYLAAIADRMGTASDEKIVEAVDAWMEENINPDVTVALDKTLSVEGAAADAKAVGSVIAPQFSTSTTYAIGDYCIHEGTLYRFTSAHTGAWSASDVEATNVGDEVGDLKSAIDDVADSCKDGTGVLVEQGYFNDYYKAVDNSFGTYKYKYIAADNTFIMNRDETAGTKKVGISMNDSGLTLAQRLVSIADYPVCRIHVDTNIPQANNPIAMVYLYQSNGTTVNHNYNIALETGSADYVVDVAQKIADMGWANDVYYVIQFYTSDSATYDSAPYIHATNYGFFTATQAENYNLTQKYTNLNTRLTAAEAVTAKAITEIGETNLADWTKFFPGYLISSGTVTTPNSVNKELTTDFIEVIPTTKYMFQLWVAKTGDPWVRYEYFDNSKTYISKTEIQTATEVQENYNYIKAEIIIPIGTKYIRISWRSYGDSKIKFERGDATTDWTPGIGETVNNKAWSGTQNKSIYGIIHRGCGEDQIAPENTIPGFIWGKKAGFDYAETDIRYTSDGVAVLLHDASINRTARNSDGTEITGTVNIASITYAQALTYDFGIYKGQEYAGTKIPTLEEFIVLCKNINLHAVLELKAFKDEQSDISNIVKMLRSYGMLNHVSWLAGNYAHLFYVRDNDPAAHLCLLTSDSAFNRDIAILHSLKTTSNEVTMTILTDFITAERKQAMLAEGITCNAYCPNTQQAMLAIDEFVTSVTSDKLNYETVRMNSILGE
jgi:glycerophosphoryl diester phosphodiesterase